MILKDKALLTTTSAKIKAGQKQELDVAFYLRRAFKDHPQVFVFNDVKFKHNGESAQIDHLIVYTYGFILIESKSITGEVAINKHQEWSRSYRGQWRGMPSPIKQVELQLALLKSLIIDNAPHLLPKMFGKIQQNFGGREWHGICVISSNAIINRDNTPKALEERLVKSEFIADKLLDIMKLHASTPNALHFFSTNVRPWFSEESLVRICEFLLEQNIAPSTQLKPDAIASNLNEPSPIYQDESAAIAPITPEQPNIANEINLQCKLCNNQTTLKPRSGRYGYFFTCGECDTNTPMKTSCPQCSSANTKVSKRKELYSLVCGDCENTILFKFDG
ncbi:Nuclease-related domain-containing protein [Pseudoalteromonas sp. DSM 26666]|uniref:nuclease-related domain-containing protein n=1 Tax=Pseudoalteromonas sp. DSM 26666 TaxID=1761892 RepID=UPI0008E76345|nr:nuclease-related domain-containing protein [Pseudoalteromonas sp. DSM 26666]SFT64698.1 Nuclease-related domain-containing protein [Pseudoalteromonas sp. DSM 26666]